MRKEVKLTGQPLQPVSVKIPDKKINPFFWIESKKLNN